MPYQQYVRRAQFGTATVRNYNFCHGKSRLFQRLRRRYGRFKWVIIPLALAFLLIFNPFSSKQFHGRLQSISHHNFAKYETDSCFHQHEHPCSQSTRLFVPSAWYSTFIQIIRLQNLLQTGIHASLSAVITPLILQGVQVSTNASSELNTVPSVLQKSVQTQSMPLSSQATETRDSPNAYDASTPTTMKSGEPAKDPVGEKNEPITLISKTINAVTTNIYPYDNNRGRRLSTRAHFDAGQILNPPVFLSQSIDGLGQKESARVEASNIAMTRKREALIGTNGIETKELDTGKYVCRIHNIGRLKNGTLLLPKWMDEQQLDLTSKCGLRNFAFVIENENEWPNVKVDSKRLGPVVDRQDIVFHQGNCDLFSQDIPRYHMPHFLSDMILPMLQLQTYFDPQIRYPTIWTLNNGKSERNLRGSTISPCIIMPSQLWSSSPSSWVVRVANFFLHPRLRFSFMPDTEEIHIGSTGRPLKNITLFRSIVTSNINPYQPSGLFSPNGNNIVYDLNGISRDSAWRSVRLEGNRCHAKVTALTRKGPRALLHLDKLRQEILRKAENHGIMVDFKVVEFSHKPFDEQVRIVQDTNVLIGTHGAGNANIAFMKPHSTLIEIFPFSYRAGPFDGFAYIFGLNYISDMSAPQTKTFKDCMRQTEKDEAMRNKILSLWDKAVAEEKKSPWVHRLEFEKEFGKPGEGFPTRICARAQQLEFNIAAVSEQAVNAASSLCFAAKAETNQRGTLQ